MSAPATGPRAPAPYAFTPTPDDTPKLVRWGRIILTLVLIPVGLSAFNHEYGVAPLIGGINLAIHEFGHMLFMPFGIPVLGETMVILGGSLTQVALPLVFVGYFLVGRKEHRDLHAAMICLWWTSISLLNVAIYAADARARQLMLITGATGREDDSGHDFYNLFSQWGVLQRDTVYAGRLKAFAFLLFMTAIVVGFTAAWRSPRTSGSPSNASG